MNLFATMHHDSLPYLTESKLIRRAQDNDVQARDQLWTHYARMVLSVVNDLFIPRHLLADAIQEGLLGLYTAIQSFDVSSLDTFSTFAGRLARRHIQRFLFRNCFSVPIPSNWFYVYCRFANSLFKCPTRRSRLDCLDWWNTSDPGKGRRLFDIHRVARFLSLIDCHDLSQHTGDKTSSEDHLHVLDQLLKAIDTLPERERNVIVMRFWPFWVTCPPNKRHRPSDVHDESVDLENSIICEGSVTQTTRRYLP